MAAQSSFLLAEEELSCPICFEDFNLHEKNRQPKLLLCLHTFCLSCMETLRKYDGSLQCSICRTSHHVYRVSDLMDNYVIFEHLKIKQEHDDEKLAAQLKLEYEESMRVLKEQEEKDAQFAREEEEKNRVEEERRKEEEKRKQEEERRKLEEEIRKKEEERRKQEAETRIREEERRIQEEERRKREEERLPIWRRYEETQPRIAKVESENEKIGVPQVGMKSRETTPESEVHSEEIDATLVAENRSGIRRNENGLYFEIEISSSDDSTQSDSAEDFSDSDSDDDDEDEDESFQDLEQELDDENGSNNSIHSVTSSSVVDPEFYETMSSDTDQDSVCVISSDEEHNRLQYDEEHSRAVPSQSEPDLLSEEFSGVAQTTNASNNHETLGPFGHTVKCPKEPDRSILILNHSTEESQSENDTPPTQKRKLMQASPRSLTTDEDSDAETASKGIYLPSGEDEEEEEEEEREADEKLLPYLKPLGRVRQSTSNARNRLSLNGEGDECKLQ